MTEEEELTRELGFLEATSMGLGTMIGGGIFILPSIAAAQAGSASMISFAIGGGVSLLAALSLSELATSMPSAGGSYYFVRRALGPLAGSVVGWGMWTGLMFASAFYAVGFGQYLTYFHGSLPIVVAAVAMALGLLGLNYYSAAEAGIVEDGIVLSLLLLLLVFVGLGVPAVSRETFEPFNPEGWGAVISTVGTVYVTFIGFETIASAAEEVEDPGRTLPRSMLVSVIVPTILYVIVMAVSTGVLPVDELAGSDIPVADVARVYLGQLGVLAMVLGAVLATVSSANASILSAGRISLAMGRDAILTDWLQKTHEQYGTPSRAIAVTGVGILALVVVRVGLNTLAEVAGFLFLVSYALVHVAVVVMRRNPEAHDPTFRLSGALYPAVPVVGVLASVGIMTQMDPIVIGGGLTIIVAGAAWYLIVVRSRIDCEE